MKIAVTSPTGHIGRPLVGRLLKAKGHAVVLLARNPQKLKKEIESGAHVEVGDLTDSNFYTNATKGADVLFHLSPPNPVAKDVLADYKHFGQNAAAAIKSNEIKRVVHLSSMGAHLSEGTGPVMGLHYIEGFLNETGAALTHLRPPSFFENFLNFVGTIQSTGSIFLPIPGSTRIPMIATRDIAEEAANIILDTSWSGQRVVELHGSADITFDEAAQMIGNAIGKDVKVITLPPEEIKKALLAMNLSESYADLLNEMYLSMASGKFTSAGPRTPENTTKTTFKEFVELVLAPVIKNSPQS